MKLINADCLVEMDKLIAEGVKVDAIICDPPFGTVNGMVLKGQTKDTTKWDEIIDHEQMLEKCNKLLRMNGCLVLFSQDPYTSKLATETHGNLPFSYRMTWLKDHFASPLSAKKAPVNYTEDINVFFKKYDTEAQHPLREYALKIKEFVGKNLKEINKDLGHRQAEHFFYINSTQFGLCTETTYNQLIDIYTIDEEEWFKTFEELEFINRTFSRTFNLPEGKKYKSNVLEYKKDYTGQHPTQKPVLLMEDLVRTYTNEGNLVLDFTMGSGTTGVACKNLNREFIGIELDEKYFKIAEDRIKGQLI